MATYEIPYVLVPNVVDHISSLLSINEVTTGLRRISKAVAEQLNSFRTVTLSKPVPHYAIAERWGSPAAMRPLDLAKRKKLLCLIAASGVLENLQLVITATGLLPFPELSEAAAATAQPHILRWLQQEGWPLGNSLCVAAGCGHATVCELILTEYDKQVDGSGILKAAEAAARSGRVGLMDSLQQRSGAERAPLDLVVAAAAGCNLAVFQSLLADLMADRPGNQLEVDTEAPDLVEAAAGSDTPDWRAKVEHLEARGGRGQDSACRAAARRPDAAERLAWLLGRDYPLGPGAFRCAAEAGNTAALRHLLVEVDTRPDPEQLGEVIGALVRGGHLEGLQLVHSVMGQEAMAGHVLAAARDAVRAGQVEVVEWLDATFGFPGYGGADRTEVEEEEEEEEGLMSWLDVSLLAARSGSVRMLEWVRSRRRWAGDAAAVRLSVMSGCGEALDWVVAHGCGLPDNGLPYSAAARTGDLGMLRHLRRRGCPWGPPGQAFAHTVKDAPTSMRDEELLSALQWLLEEGCPVDWHAAVAAAEMEHVQPLPQVGVWLRQECLRREGQQAAAMLPPPPPP